MENKKSRDLLITFLKKIGADTIRHSGRTLFDHLLGTYDILAQWKCDELICIAGGLHSIYGTNAFAKETCSFGGRSVVSQYFGEDAESLAWLFGSLNRPKAIELAVGVDRRRNVEVIIREPELKSLRLIEAANLLEQGASIDKWPVIMKVRQEQTGLGN